MTPDGSTPFWVLNADCERELERPRNYQPSAKTELPFRKRAPQFLALTREDPWALPTELLGRREPLPGPVLFWCPTPSVLRLVRGLTEFAPDSPCLATLQRVNGKTFLGRALPEHVHPERRVASAESELLQLHRSAKRPLRIRREFGFAGRGARVIPLHPSADDHRFIDDSLQKGPLVVEPELERRAEWSIHGVVSRSVGLLGEPCRLHCDSHGAPRGAPERVTDCPHDLRLREVAQQAAQALLAEGYTGPFGLDFIESSEGLFATDLNARFTLGFSAGFGLRRGQAIGACLTASAGSQAPGSQAPSSSSAHS